MPTNQELIIADIVQEQAQINDVVVNSYTNIVAIDAEKEPYQNGINALDILNYTQLNEANIAINSVGKAYQDRIDSGCRSDLFWRVVDIATEMDGDDPVDRYSITVTKIQPSGIGVSGYSSIVGAGVTSDKLTLVDQDGTSGITSIGLDSKLGFVTDFYHGLKIYDEPFYEDLIDSYVIGAVGRIGFNTNSLFLFSSTTLSGTNSGGIGIETGMQVTSSKNGVFPGVQGTNTIVAVGTTVVNIQEAGISGINTTTSTVFLLTLENNSTSQALAPDNNSGDYVIFNIIRNPDDFDLEELSLPFDTPVYTPQTIKIMTEGTIGHGVKIEKNNSGEPNITASWNQFMEGLFDYTQDDPDVVVVEPSVGAGRSHYRVGFNRKPRHPITGNDASEGTTIQVLAAPLSNGSLYSDTSSCSTEIANNITNAIASRDALENAIANDNGKFKKRLTLANGLRKQLERFNLRIFAYRLQSGDSKRRQAGLTTFQGLLDDQEFLDVLNSNSPANVIPAEDPFNPAGTNFNMGSLGIVNN